jgi:acyl dehydratase
MFARHVFSQGPVLATLGRTAARALLSNSTSGPAILPPTPGPEIVAVVPPRPGALMDDFVRHVGGEPSAYRTTVPPHMFPQWAFPVVSRALSGLPYPLVRVVNAGCRLELNAELPRGRPLTVRARIESIDDDGRRAIIRQRIVTETDDAKEAVVAYLNAFVPLAKPDKGKKDEGAKGNGKAQAGGDKLAASVPTDARELAWRSISERAGLEFAHLTGDYNPIHWVARYARAVGFRSTILHGFSTFARTLSVLERSLLAGARGAIRVLDVRFAKPLVLPAQVGFYVKDHAVWVASGPGATAYLSGTYELYPTRAPGAGAHG